MKMNRTLLILFTFFSLVSCNMKQPTKGREAILEVEGKFLYKDEIDKLIPLNTSATDSATIADKYIKNWVIDVLVYENARRNISDYYQIDQLVDEYRKSLIIHEFEEALIAERISTNIPETTIRGFYDSYKEQIKLEENIIKGILLIVPIDAPEIDKIKSWVKKADKESLEEIEKYSLRNAISYDYFMESWTSFSEISKKAPFDVSDTQKFLRENRYSEVADSSRNYLLHIREVALEGEISPYEFSKDIITTILINKKKSDFVNNFENTLYNDALKNKEITFFNK